MSAVVLMEWVWTGAWTCIFSFQQWEVHIPSPVPSPGCYPGILLPGASAQGLPHPSVSARATESGIYWGWYNPKGHQAVWPPFSSTCMQCLWLLLDAAQGVDILISGMDSRSFLITAVERKREILFSDLFNQFIQMLWPTGYYFSCLGTWTFLMQSFRSETDKPLVSGKPDTQGHRLTVTELLYPEQAASLIFPHSWLRSPCYV